MSEAAEQTTAIQAQTIILKEGCWVKTSAGFRRTRQRIKTEATPILSACGEVVGFRFRNFLYQGVSHDLEKIIIGDGREK